MRKTFTLQELEKADKLINIKQKVYYPWEQKHIERVVLKDKDGYYVQYGGKKLGCIPQMNGMETDIIGFMALKCDGRN